MFSETGLKFVGVNPILQQEIENNFYLLIFIYYLLNVICKTHFSERLENKRTLYYDGNNCYAFNWDPINAAYCMNLKLFFA